MPAVAATASRPEVRLVKLLDGAGQVPKVIPVIDDKALDLVNAGRWRASGFLAVHTPGIRRR